MRGGERLANIARISLTKGWCAVARMSAMRPSVCKKAPLLPLCKLHQLRTHARSCNLHQHHTAHTYIHRALQICGASGLDKRLEGYRCLLNCLSARKG